MIIRSFLKENLLIISILSIILVLCFFDVVFLGKTFKLTTGNSQALMTGPFGQENNRPEFFPVHSTDVPVFEEPIMQFIKNSFKQGFIPLWNPHQACGVPFIGMMQTGIFFPLNIVMYLLPNTVNWDILIFLRLLLSGLLTFWFMRTLKFKKIPSICSAMAFMISSPMIFIHWSTVHVDILLPLLLLVIEKLVNKTNLRHSAFLAIVVSFTCFAGNPEHVFLVNAYGLVFFIVRFLTIKKSNNIVKTTAFFCLSYLWGLCLSAIILLPFLQNWLTEFWHSHSEFIGAVPEGSNIFKETLINFVMPSFFQREIVTMKFVRSTFWGHIGIIPLGLAFISLFSKQRKGLNYFFAIMAVLIFVKSYVNFPLTNWIGYLPILRNCRFTHHTQHLFFFSIMALSGMGLRYLLVKKNVFKFSLLYTALVLPLMSWALFSYRNADHLELSLKSFLLALTIIFTFNLILFLKDKGILKQKIFLAIILSLLLGELFIYIPKKGRVKRFDSFPKVPYMEFLKKQNPTEQFRSYGAFWTFHPNTASGYNMDDFGIVEGLLPKRYVRFINNFISPNYFKKGSTTSAFWITPVTFSVQTRPYFNMLNVKYTIAPENTKKRGSAKHKSNSFESIYSEEVKVYEHRNTLPRAFIVHRAIFESNEDLLIKKVQKIRNDFRVATILHALPKPHIIQELKKAPVKSKSTAKIIQYHPNNVIINATMTHPGMLILGDSYHPDWKAFINGKPTEIFIANTLVRAVFLPTGNHSVTFEFKPIWFYIGRILTLLTIILTIIMLSIKKHRST